MGGAVPKAWPWAKGGRAVGAGGQESAKFVARLLSFGHSGAGGGGKGGFYFNGKGRAAAPCSGGTETRELGLIFG